METGARVRKGPLRNMDQASAQLPESLTSPALRAGMIPIVPRYSRPLQDDPAILCMVLTAGQNKAYVVLPDDSKMPIAMSGGSYDLLSKVRASCRVHIECEPDDNAIRITGRTPAHIQAAIRDINDAIRGQRTKEATGHQHLLVQPPSTSTYANGVIILHPGKGTKQGARPRFQAKGHPTTTPIPNFTPGCHEDKVANLFRDAMSTLQAMGCNLRMRANIGFVRLNQQQHAPSEFDVHHFVNISDTLPGRAATKLDKRYVQSQWAFDSHS